MTRPLRPLLPLFFTVLAGLAGAACEGRPSADLTFGIDAEAHEVFFPIARGVHALDTALDGDEVISCDSCHGAATSFREFECTSCHKTTSDGLEVHSRERLDQKHGGLSLYAFESTACLQCHPRGDTSVAVSRDDHTTEFFPIDEPSAHGEIACSSCHTSFNTTGDTAAVSCTTCHEHERGVMDSAHGTRMASMGYRFASTDPSATTPTCVSCHPGSENPGIIDPALHTTFPVAAEDVHAGYACVDCHASGAQIGTSTGVVTPFLDDSDRTNITCISCHEDNEDATDTQHGRASMDEAHEVVTGYLYADATDAQIVSTSKNCYACHKQSQVPGVLDHTSFFPIDPEQSDVHALGRVLGPRDVPVDCVSCHRSAVGECLTDADCIEGTCENLTCVVDTTTTDPSIVDCLECHTDGDPANITPRADLAATHGVFPDYEHSNAKCLLCHYRGEKILDHTGFFPIAPGDTHELGSRGNPDAAANPVIECGSCHADAGNRVLLACTSCHQNQPGATDVLHAINAQHGDLTGYDGNNAQACFTCHRDAQVPGEYDHAAFPLAADHALASPPGSTNGITCADCHTDRANRRTTATLDCIGCHLDPNTANCPGCATPGAGETAHSEAFMTDTHDGVPGFTWSPASCVGCHPDGTGDVSAIEHPFFPIVAGSKHEGIACDECHTTPGVYTVVDCTACHQPSTLVPGQEAHSQQAMTTVHDGVPGFTFSSSACLLCHPNAEHTGLIDHESLFPLNAPAPHNGIACNECHTNPNNNAILDCVTCHRTVNTPAALGVVHTGVPGYSETTAACLDCHSQGQRQGTMDHTAYFPVAVGTPHGTTSCTQCHSSYANRAQTLCSTCHATLSPTPSSTHTSNNFRGGSFVNDSIHCKECHADAQVDPLSSHSAFNFRHEGASCKECHLQMRTDKPWGINWSFGTCTECHSANCTPQNEGPCD